INNFDKMGRILRTGNQTPEKTKIVIVGAGIAGLAAAKTLEEANFKDYLLLEAQSEIGGRIRTIPWNKTRIECGAQFLHGDQSQLGELCYQNGLISDIDFRDGQGSFIRNNGAKVDEALVEEIDDLVRTTLEDCENEKKYLEKGFENLDNYKTMFVPPLPQFVGQAIENLGFGLINKIFLDFGKAWWKRDTKGFQFLWPENTSGTSSNGKAQTSWTRDLTGFDVLPDSDGVLLGWVGGCGAYIVETLSEQQIAADCERLLKQYLKIDAIPPVIKCLRTKWYSNPYIRGSYSHIPTRCDDKGITPATLAEPICSKVIGNHSSQDMPTIMFAGEATSETHFSTTHGAYDTGVQQARVFLRYH
ncbi:Peroxisomal N(1)-acetyl-spermine/spermidine oxidase, partial [Dufourea novaeangliae]